MRQIGVKNVKLSEYEMSIAAHLVDPLTMQVKVLHRYNTHILKVLPMLKRTCKSEHANWPLFGSIFRFEIKLSVST